MKFDSGRLENFWQGNAAAVGNASGFVEPLEATAIMIIAHQARTLAAGLMESSGSDMPGPRMQAAGKAIISRLWDEVRDFLSVHYRFNTRLDTPFWQHCRTSTPLHGAQPVAEYYQECGPSTGFDLGLLPPQTSLFQLEGFYTLLLGQKVPHARTARTSGEDNARWQTHRRSCRGAARKAFTMAEGLALIRSPQWHWTPGFYASP